MNASVAADLYARWLDAVAATVHPFVSQVKPRRRVTLIENEEGELVFQSMEGHLATRVASRTIGIKQAPPSLPHELEKTLAERSGVDVYLQHTRFLFRPLELPVRAQDFLSDIVSTQIDRLTPWAVNAAAYGWSRPASIGDERIRITVAATSLASLQPLVSALADAGAGSIAIYTAPPDAIADPSGIKVYEKQCDAVSAGLRRPLTVVLAVAALLGIGAIGLSSTIGAGLARERAEHLRDAAGRTLSSEAGARAFLQRRKHDQLPTVLLVEALAEVLPDDTHVTELHVQDRALRLTGITRDAPALIRLLEQSRQFSKVRFFAPTTQASPAPGARFHIEAEIQPLGAPVS